MNFSRNFKFRATALSIALIASGFVSAGSSSAVTVTPFTALYNKNINGQVVVTGNTNMTCPTTKDALGATIPAAESTACQEARVRTIKSGLNLNNNAYRMIYAGAGSFGNKTMINSSAANVTVPVGSTIKSAFLFWHGDMSKPSNADGGKAYNSGVAKGCENDANFCRDKVWLLTPKDTAAQVVTATAMSSENPTSGLYRAHADITRDLVQINDNKWTVANGQKSITVRVGDIESAQGRDTQAGWSIIVAYAHPEEDLRNVVIYGGLAKVAQNDPAEVSLTGLQTPPTGNVTTTFGVVAAEGDASEGGDFMTLLSGTTRTTVADAANPANNPANSTIARNGAIQPYFNNTDGRYTNTFGTDADLLTLKNALPNNATSATVQMGTNLETYYPIAFTMATELYSPEIQLTKIATGVTKADGSTPETSSVDATDRITYRIYFTNIATVGTATNVVVTDTLPANLTFLSTPSSGLGCSGSGQTFTCSIGNLTAGGQGYADFVVTVDAGSGTFTNIATATYSGPAGALEATSNVVTLEYAKYTSDLIALIDTSEKTIASGGSTNLDVYIRNEGPAPDSNFETVITVPSGTVVTPPSGCTVAGTTITCDESAGTESSQPDNNTLIASEYATITIPVVLPAEGSVYDFAISITSLSDASTANNGQSVALPSNSSSTAVQTFVSMPKNKKPKAKPTSVVTKRNTAIGIDVTSLISDVNYDEMSLKFTKPNKKHGSVTLSGNTFTFKPKKNFVGTTTFYYTVVDIDGAKSSKTKVTVKVTKSGKKTPVIKKCFIRTGC
jgi:large repetitive protein